MTKTYAERKNAARNQAIAWQYRQAEQPLSQGELANFVDHFTRLGRRYGLLREFRENAII